MVERLPCKQDVPSSILGGGTKLYNGLVVRFITDILSLFIVSGTL